jgi:hypothetical protein
LGRKRPRLQLVHIELGRIDDAVGGIPQRLKHLPFQLDGVEQAFALGQRMLAAGCAVALNQHLFVGFQKKDLEAEPLLPQAAQHGVVLREEALLPQVHDESKACHARAALDRQLQKFGQQIDRHVVDTVEAHVRQCGYSRTLARARQAGDDDDG